MTIEVKQEDRKRAATYADDPETAEKALAGLLDDHPIVQDFACHRIAAYEKGKQAGYEIGHADGTKMTTRRLAGLGGGL
jgi:hypothetical protein